jgi:hypothetical protein
MKTRFLITMAPAAVVGGIILLLGCGAESKKTGANNYSPVVITANAAPQTNEPAPTGEPVPQIVTAPAKLSPGLEEIVQLAQSGVGDDVLLAFVENSPTRYKLELEEILYLHDLGISSEVIAGLVRHGQSSPEVAPPLAATAPEPSTPAENVNTNPPPPTAEAAPTDANAYAVTPPVEQVNNNYFYQSLAPYGSWIDVPAYGWCWQPTVAVADGSWRPYCHRGRWLWSDCGWYWQSDYAWGWAPFHYGRWHCSPAYGWVWYPDTVWAPAWVTWRYSNSYCGWAPLPPGSHFDVGIGFRFNGGHVGVGFGFGLASDCYTFVPTARFCDRTPWYHRLPPNQVVSIYNRTTTINNYTGGPNNGTVVNLGPGENAIAAVSRSEIRKVTLRDMNPRGGTLIKSDRLEGDGKTLAVFRPQLPKQASAPPPEITRRQQESRIKTDRLVNSDVVRLARNDAERKASAAPASRGSARTEISGLRTPLVAPKLADSDIATRVPRTDEPRKSFSEPNRNAVESTTRAPVPSAISRSPRAELRNPVKSSPTLVSPSRQGREAQPTVGVVPSAAELRRPGTAGQSVAIQRPQPELRTQPGQQPDVAVAERPQYYYQPQPDALSARQERRKVESGAPTFSAPASGRPAGQSITPPLNAIHPRDGDRRSSSPAYIPPQNNFAPTPRAVEAPAIRPSSPAPSYSPPPAVSQPQPAPSSPPPVSRPSSPPSQSRGVSRTR